MKIDFTGRGFEITNRIRNFAESKLERIKKHLDEIQDVGVVLSVEKYRNKAEIKFQSGKRSFHGAEETADMFQSIDKVVDKLESQVRKHKEKLTAKKRHTTESIRHNGEALAEPVVSHGGGEEELRVIRSERPLTPMNLDEALEELDKLNHNFIIFRDSDSERVNVVYRRDDGNVGLIDPRT